tara:strand:+ start:553 stop:810 length:258 start_codon:yes stop_codon:yes gene_type:complete
MKITNEKLKQIIKEEFSLLSEQPQPRTKAGQLAEFLTANPDYGVVFQDPPSNQYYRIYETWFDHEDKNVHISVTPYNSESLEEKK